MSEIFNTICKDSTKVKKSGKVQPSNIEIIIQYSYKNSTRQNKWIDTRNRQIQSTTPQIYDFKSSDHHQHT